MTALAPGTRLGPYEITGKLGEGGMGEVWRATDSRLKREVAIKVLPAMLAADRERVARFEREAQLLAQLHHPGIAGIHGVEEIDGARALVMELVEGEDLSRIVARGPVPVEDALAIARQIAEALQYAHEQGIVHRDLKPANVKVREDGAVKVLDFGLAKALEPAVAGAGGSPTTSPALMNSPTLTSAGTQLGVIIGTAAYMSPEQAKGRAADRRSDVWAFGCVLYEMLAGRRAFEGEDTTETLAAVVRGEPDWTALPAETPAGIRTLVERCLVKDRGRRLPDMSVASFLLAEPGPLAGAARGEAPPPSPQASRVLLAVLAGVLGAVVAGGLAWWLMSRSSPPAATMGRPHLAVSLPAGDVLGATNVIPLAISPDGSTLVYVGSRQNKDQLYLRALDDPTPRALDGTDGAVSPFFSPDGKWIAFFAGGKVKKVSTSGAALQVLASAPDSRGGCWGSDGYLYFAPSNISGIWRVGEAGGSATEVTRLDPAQGEISHRWPQLLRDRRTLLFNVWTGPGNDERALVMQTIGKLDRHVVVRGASSSRYLAASGILLYGFHEGLLAVPWRPEQGSLGSSVPVPVAETLRAEGEGASDYAVADNGTLAYVAGDEGYHSLRLAWVDRAGKVEPLPLPERYYQSVAISPDGTKAMVQIQEDTVSPWMLDLTRNTVTPFPTGPGSSQAVVWTPDGKRVIYRGTRAGTRNLYWKPADSTGEEERLTTKAGINQTPTSVSPDGRWLLFNEQGKEGAESSMWLLPLVGSRVPQQLHGRTIGRDGQFSPDGRWIAFESPESGRIEVYIVPLLTAGARQQVSIQGGTEARWSRDGSELYYRDGDRIMAVTVQSAGALSVGSPRPSHEGHYLPANNWNTPYDIGTDGRFLHVEVTHPGRPLDDIDVVLGWTAGLEQQLQQGKHGS